jgi:hypothetical protein
MLRDLIRHVLVMGLFLGGSGFVLTEMVFTLLLPLISTRTLVFILMALICWLLLDSITLAQDLARATATGTSTDGERHLLRSLSFANRKCATVHSFLRDEITAHRETARRLDQEMAFNARVMASIGKMRGRQIVRSMSHSSEW